MKLSMIGKIEANKGRKYSYEEARELVNQDLAFVSGKWKIQLNSKGQFVIGELLLDLTYQWLLPAYIPPILLGLQWHK